MKIWSRIFVIGMAVSLCLTGCSSKHGEESGDKEKALSTVSKEKTENGYDIFVMPYSDGEWCSGVGSEVTGFDNIDEEYGNITIRREKLNGDYEYIDIHIPCTLGELEDCGFRFKEPLDQVTSDISHNIDLPGEPSISLYCVKNSYKKGKYKDLKEDKLGNYVVEKFAVTDDYNGDVTFYQGLNATWGMSGFTQYFGLDSEEENDMICSLTKEGYTPTAHGISAYKEYLQGNTDVIRTISVDYDLMTTANLLGMSY